MKILLLALICLFGIQAGAQTDSTKKATTTATLLYNSNISYFGQATTERYPYLLANVTLRLPMGLYFSAGGYQMLNQNQVPSETDLGIGYDRQFNDIWSSGIAYTRSFFPLNSPLLAASNENNINLSTTYDGRLLKSALNVDYAFGKEQDIFITFTNSKSIIIGTFFNQKYNLSIEPALELVAGTRHFYETFIIEKQKRSNGKGKGLGNQDNLPTTELTEIPKNSFSLLSYNFRLPIALSRANYLIETSYQFSIMGIKADENLSSRYSLFGLAFYYQF